MTKARVGWARRAFAIAAIAIVGIAGKAEAVTFCNMDFAGGERGRRAQERSARSASAFFQAAATTFQMFAEIELDLAGDRGALDRASRFSKQARDQLSGVVRHLEGVSQETDALRGVDDALKQLTEYSGALKEARVPPTSPIATSVIDAFKKGSRAVLEMCAQSVKDLEDDKKGMARVYRAAEVAKAPVAEDLWEAVSQWNEVLIRGRVISAIFRLRR